MSTAFRLGNWKLNDECRPFIDLTGRFYCATVVLHYLVHQTQTQTGSLPLFLGSKEGLKNMRQILSRNAAASIGYGYADPVMIRQ